MILERFLNASLYLAKHTSNLDTIKLYKLLFLVDKECIKKTGQTITGCTYKKITPWGPVPKEVKAFIDSMALDESVSEDISKVLSVQKRGKNTHIEFSGEPNLDYFTDKEVAILKDLANKFQNTRGKTIAHKIHENKRIKSMSWNDEFHMDVFLDGETKEISTNNRKVACELKFALNHG